MSLLHTPVPLSGSLSSGFAACALILHALGSNKVLYHGSAGYFNATNSPRNEFNIVQEPSCVVNPERSQDVSTAMTHIFSEGANYAVLAGGHTGMVGWDNVQGGVLISFANMRNISYSSETDTVTLEPGLRWNESLTALDPFGVAVSGGRVGHIGTGLLLGGGYSHLSSQVGFSSDTIREVDVVLVNGTLVTANAKNEYNDLFKALKGGGNRFGIVTRYEVAAIHTGTKDDLNWYGGILLYNDTYAAELVKAAARYIRDVKDPKASLLMGLTNFYTNGTLSSTTNFVSLYYNDPSLPSGIFNELLSIPHTDIYLGPLSYYSVSSQIGVGDDASPWLWGASALEGSVDLWSTAYERWSEYCNTQSVKDVLSYSTFAVTPISQSQIDKSRENGGSVIHPSDGNYGAINLGRTFPPGVRRTTEEEQKAFDHLLETIPYSPGKPLYLNEADARQKIFESYGEYDAMKEIYSRYDPTRFNVKHTLGPRGL